MITEKRRTVTRTFRIPEDLSERIDKEALQKRVNPSSVVNSLIDKHFQWDSYAKRYGFVSITKDTYINLVKELDENKIAEIAKGVAAEALEDFMTFRFQRLNLRSFLECVELILTYGYIGELEIKNEGRNYSVHIVHTMGRKVSLYIGLVFKELLYNITDIESNMNISDNQIKIEFNAE